MAKCERCGRELDKEFDEKELFEGLTGCWYNYEDIRPSLCGHCAAKAVEEEEEEVLFVRCQDCGMEFDLFETIHEFNNRHADNGVDYRDVDMGFCCEDCAEKEYITWREECVQEVEYPEGFWDDGEMNEGCRACGNPDYPACRPSCGIWEDD